VLNPDLDARPATFLSTAERRWLDKLFIESGYVLDFNNTTFAEFFESEIGVDIYDPKYEVKGTSKGNRLRTFFEIADPPKVARAMRALWDYRRTTTFAQGNEHDHEARVQTLIARSSPRGVEYIAAPSVDHTASPVPVTAAVPIVTGSFTNARAGASEQSPITVLGSYAHQGEAYDARVLQLVQRLRADGIDAWCDQFVPFPKQGWPRWMEDELAQRRWVLVFASEPYKRRAEGNEDPGSGLGAIWEHGFIRTELYESGRINERFLPVGFGKSQRESVPRDLRDYTYFDLDSEADYQKLLGVLRGVPLVTPHPIGEQTSCTASQAAAPSSDDIAARYQAEDESDQEFFGFRLPTTTGQFTLTLRPIEYRPQRLSRRDIAVALEQIRIGFRNRRNIPDTMPFDGNTSMRGFGSGSGMESSHLHPELKQVEQIRIHRSGQYRITRVFEEDFIDGILKHDRLELWNEHFIRRLTLLIQLATHAADVIGLTAKELVELKVRVSGLGNRELVWSSDSPLGNELKLLWGASSCSESACEKRWIVTREELENDDGRLAREIVCDSYWNFGVTDNSVASFALAVQRELLGSAEG
jgi:hypothetical protein